MAPLRAQIMHLTKTLHVTDRKMSYFYGARALNEVFYLEDFLQIEKDFPNFTFHLALDRPDPAADAAGVKYTPGFVHNVIYETYLKNHEAPEDIEYYMCCLLYTSHYTLLFFSDRMSTITTTGVPGSPHCFEHRVNL